MQLITSSLNPHLACNTAVSAWLHTYIHVPLLIGQLSHAQAPMGTHDLEVPLSLRTRLHAAVLCCLQEQQVVALKAAHPGVLLLVEVGYKMRMFGADAEVAAKVTP
jgi:hypothetical protein